MITPYLASKVSNKPKAGWPDTHAKLIIHKGSFKSAKECRLPGYKRQVRTSQEAPYVSVTESRRLILCKI
jgi:hypothetical protein